MRDWRGNEYDVGSTVFYPAQVANRVELVEAEVLEIEPPDETRGGYPHNGRLKVRPIRSSRYNAWRDHRKPVLLTSLDNVTAVG